LRPLVDPPDAEVDGEDAAAAAAAAAAADDDDDDDDGSLSAVMTLMSLREILTISESPQFNLLDRAAHNLHSTELNVVFL